MVGGSIWQEHWERECDYLRCDIRSFHKPHIYGPRCKVVRLIGNQRNDDFQSGSDGGYLQIPPRRHIVMTADWRVILRVRRHITAHQSGATSDCCSSTFCACRLGGNQIADSLEYIIIYSVRCIGYGRPIFYAVDI
jgi:hypothetical protein